MQTSLKKLFAGLAIAASVGSAFAAGSPGVTGAFRAFGAVWLIRRLEPAGSQGIKAAVAHRFAGEAGCYVSATSLRGNAGAIVRVSSEDCLEFHRRHAALPVSESAADAASIR